MIELKGVSKLYQSKKSNSTKALNNISFKMGNKGMIFIVGKSGSGKSTLLNLLGGIDNPTDGEILFNGRPIGNFNPKEFDSYRNTCVGFVFQEFNILEEYTVYENIELALKLQSKEDKNFTISKLLKKLDLEGLEKRKTNELSGGQKQRVAIARALIKNPNFILADEPIGNLDRSSSEQIFQILKEISKEHLVIVVSHDREFAQKYADRMIEISDGRVISDSLEEEDIPKEDFQLKSSTLPFRYAFKMAISSLKQKPFKFCMTIILTAISLIFVGFTYNCFLFDSNQLFVNTMKDNSNYVYDVSYIQTFGNGYKTVYLDDSNLQDIEQQVEASVNPIYLLIDNNQPLSFTFPITEDTSDNYYLQIPSTLKFVEVVDENIFGNLIGKTPSSSNEIVVHKYLADYAIKYGIMTIDGDYYYPTDYEEIVSSNIEIKLGDNGVIITGIIDDDDSIYQEDKIRGYFIDEDLEQYYENHYVLLGNIVYVKGFTENALLNTGENQFEEYSHIIYNYENGLTSNIAVLDHSIPILTDSGIREISSVEKGKIIISLNDLRQMDSQFDTKLNQYIEKQNHGVYQDMLYDFIISYLKENQNKWHFSLSTMTYDQKILEQYSSISLTIIGVSLDETVYVSQEYKEDYQPNNKMIIGVKVFDNNISHLRKVFSGMTSLEYMDKQSSKLTEEVENIYTFSTTYDSGVETIIMVYEALRMPICIVSLIFFLFNFLLFSNFIATSISYRKKEIGILRALGTTHNDVWKIFGYESVVVGMIAWILSILGWIVICNIINQLFSLNFHFSVNVIIPNPLLPIILLVYTLFIAVFITILSLSKITKIKPIEAILNK